ncbi:hypothetical protein FRC07_007227 [Ceratobasidium sp. 392]|nr:hypothetical protein FRC07_007227 [Ceratobasidium sp. 392]
MDLEKLEQKLAEKEAGGKKGFVVVLSHGEVNTLSVRSPDSYPIWPLWPNTWNLRTASRLTQSIFGPSTRSAPPAYLAPPAPPADQTPELAAARAIPAPLNMGIENSRRFRALPLFCALVAMGKEGYAELIERNVSFARRVGEWMHTGPGSKWYEVLNATTGAVSGKVDLNVVLFRARKGCGVPEFEGATGGAKLIKAVNETRKMYVSPGVGGAVRLAVSNWMTGLSDEGEGDYKIVLEVLEGVMHD